jgi:hypothetical protein
MTDMKHCLDAEYWASMDDITFNNARHYRLVASV